MRKGTVFYNNDKGDVESARNVVRTFGTSVL